MDFEFSPKVQELRERLLAFMDEYVYPNERLFDQQVKEVALNWYRQVIPGLS